MPHWSPCWGCWSQPRRPSPRRRGRRPQNVSSPVAVRRRPQRGRSTAAAARTRPGAGRTARGRGQRRGMRLAVREPGRAEFGPERSAPNFVTPLLPYGLDRVLGLDERRRRPRPRYRCGPRFSRPDGRFGRPDTISTYGAAGGSPSLAVHDDALAAWTRGVTHGRRIVRAAIRRPGHRFGRPVTLRARGRAGDVVAAAGPGVMFVAWERAGVVEARVRIGGPRGWGPLRRIGRAAKGSNTFRATFSGRRGYLAWLAESGETAVPAHSGVAGRGAPFPRAADHRHDRPRRSGGATRSRDRPDPGARGAACLDGLGWRGLAGAGRRDRAAGAASERPVDVSPRGRAGGARRRRGVDPGRPRLLVGQRDGRLEPPRCRRGGR